MTLRIGIVGTSWWTEAMYLPALADHPVGKVVALCGRTAATATDVANRWNVPHVFTDWMALVDSGEIDALIVASSNDSHYPITMYALDAGLHVLCEKPIALSTSDADDMAAKAEQSGVTTMVPFTYRYMPMFREVKRLIDDGAVGDLYHLNLRYFTQFGRDTAYSWRFDPEIAGSGIIGDLGSHWLHLAEWLVGPIAELGAITGAFAQRDPRPDGTTYEQSEDSAVISTRFANGAIGNLQLNSMSYVGTDSPFGQTHHLEVFGSDGSIMAYSDWNTIQEVRLGRAGIDASISAVEISEESWAGVSRDKVHDTYKETFRTTEAMTRGWATAAAAEEQIRPSLADGARVQHLMATALQSAANRGCLLPTPQD